MRFNNKNVILPEPIPVYDQMPLGMKVYDGDINVLRRSNQYSDCVIYYLIDSFANNGNWEVFPVDSVGINVSSGHIIYFYGPNTNRICVESGAGKFYISGTGKVDLIGNMLSICNPNWTENMKLTRSLNTATGLFCSLFSSNNNIYNAKDMYIRTNEISCGDGTGSYSYGVSFGYMFNDCSNLLTGPNWICEGNVLKIVCRALFVAMFSGCSNLKTSTVPPITSYAGNRQVESMFKNCTSLETLYYNGTYEINNTGNSKDFSTGITQAGDFYNLRNATISRDANGIPANWTVHTSL